MARASKNTWQAELRTLTTNELALLLGTVAHMHPGAENLQLAVQLAQHCVLGFAGTGLEVRTALTIILGCFQLGSGDAILVRGAD